MKREENIEKSKKNANWGSYLVAALIVSALSLGILIYIGWLDNNNHVDSSNGDNVMASYQTATPQPAAPGVNDWINPDGSSLRQIIVDHAAGTNTTPLPE